MSGIPIWVSAVARVHAPEDNMGRKDEALIDRIALSMAAMITQQPGRGVKG